MKHKAARRMAWILAGGFLLYAAWTARAIWTFPADPDAGADAAIVLGASAKDGAPSPVFAERINHGIELYRRGLVTKMLFTGGAPEGESVPLAEMARRYASERGIPAGDILLEPYSRITYENLDYARQIGEEQGLKSYLIVSDPLHMRRAMRMALDLGMTARASPTPTTRFTSLRSRLWFLKRELYFYLQYALVTRFAGSRSLEAAQRANTGVPG
jgi:uncharacterized SAM-binding protein YcdF (DUF218 family)